jgi:hypothetical protein
MLEDQQVLRPGQKLSDAKVCRQGYLWLVIEEIPELTVYRCEGGGHWCFMMKKPPKEKPKYSIDKSGNKVDFQGNLPDEVQII